MRKAVTLDGNLRMEAPGNGTTGRWFRVVRRNAGNLAVLPLAKRPGLHAAGVGRLAAVVSTPGMTGCQIALAHRFDREPLRLINRS